MNAENTPEIPQEDLFLARNYPVTLSVAAGNMATIESLIKEADPTNFDFANNEHFINWSSSSIIIEKAVENSEGNPGFTISILPSEIEALDRVRIDTYFADESESDSMVAVIGELKEDYDTVLLKVNPKAEPYFESTKETRFLVKENVGELIKKTYKTYFELLDGMNPTEEEKKMVESFAKALTQIEGRKDVNIWIVLTQGDMERITLEIFEQMVILSKEKPDSIDLEDFRISFRTLVNTFVTWGGKETKSYREFKQLQKK